MTEIRSQRRNRSLAMSPLERDEFLTLERTCRVATIGLDGPHAAPLWFTWDTEFLWLYSLTRSQRWADVQRDPRVSAVIDAGTDYLELRGVEIIGTAEQIGEAPREGRPDPRLTAAEASFSRKYSGTDDMQYDGAHAWLRIRPRKIASWDFRKIAQLRAPGAV
ncbi:pyridoxamine 5'-phosphate oxidase [Jatrophihabitans sp. GAS493]|uniref:pyridoxamine 5'-phosphate oxidase family protein n=1 Tax=Jatrophihabitans sp. GAS493 TaxID=1907575 RepID=UPI000BC00E4D|nr:pyridoxamine 5'-phosphate oxidase family protein [Jatrophihabitans sp. GAS493]SOD72107.1 pyridoxamine 5'-phosphate oxidase [Jatrophihabitans sp. GAS493]